MKLRLPEELRDRLKTAAEANNRSMNAEIVSRLEQSLNAAEREAASLKLFEQSKLVRDYERSIKEYDHLSMRLVSIQNEIFALRSIMENSGLKFRDAPESSS